MRKKGSQKSKHKKKLLFHIFPVELYRKKNFQVQKSCFVSEIGFAEGVRKKDERK